MFVSSSDSVRSPYQPLSSSSVVAFVVFFALLSPRRLDDESEHLEWSRPYLPRTTSTA